MRVSIENELPPENKLVNTKIDKDGFCRNVQYLRRVGNLYFDGGVYVYYRPTHWFKQF